MSKLGSCAYRGSLTATEFEGLVFVTVVFEGSVDTYTNVITLLVGQFGHYTTKTFHHKRCDLLVQVLG
jgi:hypothetical protein